MKVSIPLLWHSLLLLTASQVGNVSSVLFHMAVGRRLPPAEYGDLSSMLSLVLIVGMPLGALSNALTYYTARLAAERRRGDIWALMRRWLWRLAAGALPALLLAACFAGPLSHYVKLSDSRALLLTLSVLLLSLASPVWAGALTGLQAFGWSSVSGASFGVFRLLAGAALVYFVAATAFWAMAGHALGVLASMAVAVAGLVRLLRDDAPGTAPLPGTGAYVWRTLVVLALFSFLMNADILVVKRFFAPDLSGLYARAATIGRTIVFFPMPIAGALFPKIVSDGAVCRQDRGLLLQALFYTALIVVPAGLLVSFLPQLPLGLLYNDWQPSAEMVRLVRATFWAMSPLAPAFILMNFQLAQNRFALAVPLAGVAAAYLGLVMLRHGSLFQVVGALAAAGVLALLALGAGVACTVRGAPAARGPAAGRTPAP